MLKLKDIKFPSTLAEANELLIQKGHTALAGGTSLMMRGGEPQVGVELRHLLSDEIKIEDNTVVIGAMCTLRELETCEFFSKGWLSILPVAVRHIQGPAFRNSATVGGNIGLAYPKSELLTALTALDAKAKLFVNGYVPLSEYIHSRRLYSGDIVCEVMINTELESAGICSVRNSYVEQAMLCAAACKRNGIWRISVGARPAVAMTCEYADDLPIEEIAAESAGKFKMGSDLKASSDYRSNVCATIIGRAMKGENACL